jgi:ankyrin repeat protein
MKISQLSSKSQEKLENYGSYSVRYAMSNSDDINKPITFANKGLGYIEIKKLPLHVAVELEYVEVVKELCEHGANIHLKDNLGRDAMDIAFHHHNGAPSHEIIKIINILKACEHKPKPMTKDEKRFYARYQASLNDIDKILSLAAIKALTTCEDTFSKSEKFNEIGQCGYAPLHYAAKIGDIELINELCKKGANVNQTDKNKGYSPLEYAAENGLELAVQTLLKYQPNLDSISRASKLAHHYQKSCLWSSCFWKSYKKISGEGVVNYNKTTNLLDSAISNLDPKEFKEFGSNLTFG